MLVHFNLSKILFRTKTILPFFTFFLTLLITGACAKKEETKEFKYAGGTFNFALNNEPTTFFVWDVSDFYASTLLKQVYSQLVIFDPESLEIKPSLAESWVISNNGKTLEFTLREGVYFHQHPQFKEQIQFTAKDVISSIELACTPTKKGESYAYSTIYKGILKGADDFFQKKADHIEGLKASGNTITFELKKRDINFLSKLAHTTASILSHQIIEAGLETDLIGTGPFVYDGYREVDGQKQIVLLKNNTYYAKDENGNQLPYLDSLVFKIEPRNLRQLEMFENEEILLIDGLPPSRISMMLSEGKIDKFNGTPPNLMLIRVPLLATEYYHFNLLREEFQDVNVRKAINYAINREAIVAKILKNQAFGAGTGGVVPPAAFKGYDSKSVLKYSYTYDPKKAQALLAEAGYPNGEGFPDINLKFNLGSNHSAVADEVSKQLKEVLNINVNLDGMEFQDILTDQENANGQIFRTSWFADFYSPESFLINGYGKQVSDDPSVPSTTNFSRYKNEAFDAAFEKGRHATDIVERYEHFAQAEQILMDDAPFIILWYEETIKVIYSKVRNLHINEMNHYLFEKVYIKEWTKEEWEQRSEK